MVSDQWTLCPSSAALLTPPLGLSYFAQGMPRHRHHFFLKVLPNPPSESDLGSLPHLHSFVCSPFNLQKTKSNADLNGVNRGCICSPLLTSFNLCLMLDALIKKCGAGDNISGIKCAHSSYRGPEFRSKSPHRAADNWPVPSSGICRHLC